MVVLLLAIGPALADVTVEGAARCLRQEALDLEVRQLLGDEVVDQIDLRAHLYGFESWQLSLEVFDGGRLLWERAMSVEPVDCPYLPVLVARSVERGLSALPGWGIGAPPKAPESLELAIAVAYTLPTAYQRFSLGVAMWTPIAGPVHVEWDLEAYGTLVEHVRNVGIQMAGAWAGAGPGLELDVGKESLRASVRGALGPAVVIGRRFVDHYETVIPYAALLGDLGVVSRHGLRVGLRSEMPLARVLPRQDGRPLGIPEPALRLGMSVGYTGAIGSSEGRARSRP